jgi:hypothetical protein
MVKNMITGLETYPPLYDSQIGSYVHGDFRSSSGPLFIPIRDKLIFIPVSLDCLLPSVGVTYLM